MYSMWGRLKEWFWPGGRPVYVPSAGLYVPGELAGWFADYEPLTSSTFLNALRPGMTVVDVGAHIGYYSVHAAQRVGSAGTVYAIEPSQENRTLLTKNLRAQGLTRVRVLPYAAGATNKRRMLQITAGRDMNSFYGHPASRTICQVEVEQVALDSVIHEPVHAIKLDVEGAELEALEGMRRILAENDLILCVEWNPKCLRHAGCDPMDLPNLLMKLGFTSLVLVEDEARLTMPLEEAIRTRRPQDDAQCFFNIIAQKVKHTSLPVSERIPA